jgi:LmbE family N-acetylglucosaminyl deacetylase
MWRYLFQRCRFWVVAAWSGRNTVPSRRSELAISSRANVERPFKLLIVAHPDDESLFAGEALSSSTGWMVVCVTNASNERRRREFIKAMNSIRANYTMLDHADCLYNSSFSPLLDEQLSALLNEFPYEFVVTHNAAGEYGHPQHRALHRVVRRLAPPRPLFVFDMKFFSRPRMCDGKRALLGCYENERRAIDHKLFLASRERWRKIH